LSEGDIATGCCIAGGGPAGMMLGLLLARAGVRVIVLEKHRDFLRDFRGDTIHPSTLDLMHEVGLLEEFLALPHEKATLLQGQVAGRSIPVADFSRLSTHCRFLVFMPQWDFLDFLARHAARYPGFSLRMQSEAIGFIEENGRVTGVQVSTPGGTMQVRADLVVAADGRHSIAREQAGLRVQDLGAPMDVLWFRLSRRPQDPAATMGRFEAGRIMVTINRGEHWQCAFVIPKGGLESIRERGLDAFRQEIARALPFAEDRLLEIASWEDVKLLTVRVDRLRKWFRPGLLCIGDAAHAMSPIGGVGINLAIQDAVAAANLLAEPLRAGPPASERLRAVQRRRELPTRLTQRLQVIVQNRVIRRVLAGQRPLRVPVPLRLLERFPALRRFPAYLIGMGVRPEHVRLPSRPPAP
jgi:2-polyprenyl-6-methoxyphenol hydroxylase-like FAD-dependent oxidoreductase